MKLLITKVVPIITPKSLLLLRKHGKPFLTASIIGVTINAYLAMGFTKVVYMAIFELSFSVGRSKVICDCTLDPNIKYPKTAIDAYPTVDEIKQRSKTCNHHKNKSYSLN